MKLSTNELGRQAYKEVKNLIVSRQLEPGKKIVQEKLAEQLGISRTPLRTALQMLEAESLVESIPRRGVVVREFSREEIREIYDCRIALEVMAIQLFTENAVDKDIQKLRKLFNPYTTTENISQKKYQVTDSIFHDTLIRSCGNSFLYDLFKKGNLLVCIDMLGLLRPPSETLQEHLDIITAIENRNAEQACKLMREHLEKTKRLFDKTEDN
ncbi:GntR family transcriptional regulator [Poritiphilus flavus]|uniref:FCD domain-containing protein n=1 Tax=Poritiphilus flavus TaxID=2697053 RepID=A0A6L9ECT5_9FLAO|nr:GntR family transcriptional regulator [Poritiphilus flavus]NAS12209.1 FCD domain-containing protein [Poritiphilus flavus]